VHAVALFFLLFPELTIPSPTVLSSILTPLIHPGTWALFSSLPVPEPEFLKKTFPVPISRAHWSFENFRRIGY
jgi:hypothetical protein